jgi:glycosyltransferase involved in cell wall biosynthesis
VASGRFDVVHVTHFEAGFLGRELDGQPRVFVPIDTWSLNEWERARATHGVPRLRDRIERVGIERFERRSLPGFPVTVVVSEADRQALLSLVPNADVRVIPNGVDSGWFAPVAAAQQSTPVVVFHGSLHYEPNVDAATFLVREIMPLVRERIGAVDVRLVGRRPVPEVLELAAPDVEIHADVPDLRPLVGGATVAVVPLRYGSGVKNKVLEAAALGVATVVTPRAHAGLDLVDGEEVLVADGTGPLADAIVRVLTDEALRERLAAGGRRAVVERWSWDVAARAFSRVYEEVATL